MEDRPYVTFDSNLFIAARNDEQGTANENDKKTAALTHELLGFNRAGTITVSVTLTSLLELTGMNAQELTDWLMGLGIAQENIHRGPRPIACKVGDTVLSSPDQGVALNHRLQEILSPSIPFLLVDHIIQRCEKLDITGTKREAMNEMYLVDVHHYFPPTADAPWNRPTPHLDALEESDREELATLYKRLLKEWRRGKWDTLALFEHITNAVYTPHPEHSIFVTNDQADFIKKGKLEAIRKLGFPGQILDPQQAIDFIKVLLAQAQPG